MYFVSLKAKNFQSFKDLHYEYKHGVPVLVLGENITDDGQESNGSGKSVILSGPEYCILHTTSKNVNDKDLVYWWDGSDSGEISLDIHCPIRKETLLIERRIALKGGGQSQVSINSVVKYAFDDRSVNEIDKFIVEWIGVSKEDIQNFFILSKFKYVSFFKSSNTAITQLIGRFSNSNIIAGIDKDILYDADFLEQKRIDLTEKKNKYYGMIEAHKANIERERTVDRSLLVKQRLEEIDNKILEEGEKKIHYHTQISIESEKIAKLNDESTLVLSELDRAAKQLQKLNEESKPFDSRYAEVDLLLAEVKEQRDETSAKYDSTNKSSNELWLTLKDIEKNIKGSVKCPNCQFEFVVGQEDISIEDEKEALKEAENLSKQFATQLETIKTQLDSFEPKIKDLKRDRLTIEAEENELRQLKRSIQTNLSATEMHKSRIDVDISTCTNRIAGHRQSVKEIEQRASDLSASKLDVTEDMFDNKERITAIQEEIKNCDTQILVIEELDKTYADQIFEIKKWAFTFKEFMQHLSIKTLKVLQGYANDFLQKIRSDLRIQLEGYRLKADGTLSDKITAYIIRDAEQKEFNNFSGGEKARLELAMVLALQHAINSTNAFGGLDFLSVDEILESADGAGISALANSLVDLHRTILLATHVPVNSYDCESVTIIKENKVSRIKE